MVAENLKHIRARIAQAAHAAGRAPEEIVLVGVTKGQSIERVREGLAAGLTDLGHNYVQAVQEQATALARHTPAPRWHFVGNLQRNKVKALLTALPEPPLVHTLDRIALADEIERHAKTLGVTVDCLVDVKPQTAKNLSQLRAGCTLDALKPLLLHVAGLSHLRVIGLMILPPLQEDPTVHFRWLRSLRDEWQPQIKTLQHLSMGMSDDFEVAIREGATYIRIGTGIFGERSKN